MLDAAQQQKVLACIAAAERATSGELRVHLEASCSKEPVARAIEVFHQLGMQQTAQRNGVLIYLAFQDQKFAIIGDTGIDAKVPTNFWNSVRDRMLIHFKEKQIAEGLCEGITHAGQKLAEFFPPLTNDQNELSNDISFGWKKHYYFSSSQAF